MKFALIDKITEIQDNEQLTAVKNVSLAEEYLGDHFPAFPVLPGVFLLQGLIESASWLVRSSQGFSNSMVLLNSARNVKYKSFAAPGAQISYHITAKKIEDKTSSFTGAGFCGEEAVVEAKIALRHFNLADETPAMAKADKEIVEKLKSRWALLTI